MEKYFYDLINNAGVLSIEEIAIRIIVSVILGIAIFISYRMTHTGTVYSSKFNITLLTLTILTTTVMTVIGNNIALSLGMVGALSIIRFRTSIKDSRDTIYIFWTIIVGICCGVGDFIVAGIGSSAVFVVLLLFGRVKTNSRILIIIRASRHLEADIRKVIFEYFPISPTIKVSNSTSQHIELIYETNQKTLEKARKKETIEAATRNQEVKTLFDKLYNLGDVEYVNIVTQNDEIS